MNDEFKLTLFLMEFDNLVQRLASSFNVPPQTFKIMGGFARRLYMHRNGIPMTDADHKAMFSSADVDFFFDIGDLIEFDPTEYDMHPIRNGYEYRGTETDTVAYDKNQMKWIEEYHGALRNIWQYIMGAVDTDSSSEYREYEDHIDYSPVKSVRVEFPVKYITRDVHMWMEEKRIPSQVGNNSPSSTVSANNSLVVAPVSDTLQFIGKRATHDEVINGFDMECAKFELSFPFSSNEPVKRGAVDDSAIYRVENFTVVGEQPPFRLIKRMEKYSGYGFTFSEQVVCDILKYSIEYVENNPYVKCLAYSSEKY